MSSMTEKEKLMYEGLMIGTDNISYMLDVIDWLNAHHFDYRGLIDKSLALDATGLNIYWIMIIGAIIIGVFIFVLFIWATHDSNRYGDRFDAGVFKGAMITSLIFLETLLIITITEEPTPSALDVYRGNTELEITSVNGTSIDTIVVFKKELK